MGLLLRVTVGGTFQMSEKMKIAFDNIGEDKEGRMRDPNVALNHGGNMED